MRSRQPIPRRIREAPVLYMGLEIYLSGFLDLDGSRALGMSAGPIPWVVVEDYCQRLDLDEEQIADMHHHITQMDLAVQKWRAAKE